MEEISNLIKNSNVTIICDTNVFLRIYDYSPEFTDFALKCLKSVEDRLKIPYTAYLEFDKHYRGKYNTAKTKIKNYDKRLNEIVIEARKKVENEFKRIETYHFPDLIILRTEVENSFDELSKLFSNYLNEHKLLIQINDEYLTSDPVKKCFEKICMKSLLQPFEIKEVYSICDDGFGRYESRIPPGFKDKNKDGLRKYNDLILWKEILKFSKTNKTDVIFVTDDIKLDWWEEKTSINGVIEKTFHSKLVCEFEKETDQKIKALTSNELFRLIATELKIKITDAIGLALEQSFENFIDKNRDKVFQEIENRLIYSPEEFIEDGYEIGSEGLSDVEVMYELISAEQIERNEGDIIYIFKYDVQLMATSTEYWGRDEDTKEIIESPPNIHKFEGEIIVEVTRYVDEFIDFSNDNKFESVEIIDGNLKQTEYTSCYEGSEF